jgi:hypothetical protein
MQNAEKVLLTLRKLNKTLQKMLNAIGDSLSNLECADDAEDGEDEEDDQEDTDHGMLSEDNELGCVKGTNSKMLLHHMECLGQTKMWVNKLTQYQWGDTTNYFSE